MRQDFASAALGEVLFSLALEVEKFKDEQEGAKDRALWDTIRDKMRTEVWDFDASRETYSALFVRQVTVVEVVLKLSCKVFQDLSGPFRTLEKKERLEMGL
ncbi:unnamed protein product [Lota lota]